MSDEPEIRSSEDFVAARERQAAEAVKSRARAEALWQRLQALGEPKTWRKPVLEDPTFQNWALCERLCHESAALADDDAGRAGELVELALELAPSISLPANRRAGLLEYVVMHVGNVCRARGDLSRAEEAFARAQQHFLESVTGILPGILERARLSGLESALLRDRGELAGALEKIQFALRLAGDRGSSRPALLLEEGRLRRRLGEPELALTALTRASQSTAGSADTRLLLGVRIALGSVLCDLGRHGEVGELPAALQRAAQGLPTEQTRLRCLGGRVAAGLGRLPEAEAALEKACADLGDRAAADVALLLLDIAAASLRLGKTAGLPAVIERAQWLAGSAKLRREAAATLKLFSRLAAQDKVAADRAAQFAKDFAKLV